MKVAETPKRANRIGRFFLRMFSHAAKNKNALAGCDLDAAYAKAKTELAYIKTEPQNDAKVVTVTANDVKALRAKFNNPDVPEDEPDAFPEAEVSERTPFSDDTPYGYVDEYEKAFSLRKIQESRMTNPDFTRTYNGYVTTVAVCVNGMRLYHGFQIFAVSPSSFPDASCVRDAAVNVVSAMGIYLSDEDIAKTKPLERCVTPEAAMLDMMSQKNSHNTVVRKEMDLSNPTKKRHVTSKPKQAHEIYTEQKKFVAMTDDTPAGYADEYEEIFAGKKLAEAWRENDTFTDEQIGYVTSVAVCLNGKRLYHGFHISAVKMYRTPTVEIVRDAAISALRGLTDRVSDADVARAGLLEAEAEPERGELDLVVGHDITGYRDRGSQFFGY